MIYECTRDDMLRVGSWGRLRQEEAEAKGLQHAVDVPGYSGLQSHIDGVQGEYAVKEVFHCTGWVIVGVDPGWDLVLPDGRRCSVRTRRPFKDDTHFIIHDRRLNWEVGVLVKKVQFHQERVEVARYITKASFVVKAKERDYGYGKCLYVTEQEMEPIELLAAELNVPEWVKRLAGR